jgi:hypothetical protein
MTDRISWTVSLDLATKLVGVVASISLAASLIFDWGFYSALNLSFLEVPTSFTDHMRSALIWFPKVVTALGGLFVFEMLTRRIEHGMTEQEIIESTSNPQRTKRFRDGPYKMLAYISVFVVIAYVLLGDIFLGGLPFGLIISWFIFSEWAQSHPRIIERRSLHLRLTAHFLPPIASWLFFSGYVDAVKIFQSTTPNLHITVASNTMLEPVTLLRQMDRGLLVKEANNSVSFRPWSEIKKIETFGKYVPSKGFLCSWFGVGCIQIQGSHAEKQETNSKTSIQRSAQQAVPPDRSR